jgi:chromate reductase, NAD(P)H dehydrogenase (quinone)
MLAPAGVTIVAYNGLGGLPHFNPDFDTESPPDAVRELRACVGQSDGIFFCSPEYAHGIAGALKNTLDWLVASSEFYEKPVAIINAAPRAVHADAQLREILSTMSARICEAASIALPLQGRNLDAAAIAADEPLAQQLRRAIAEFAAFIDGRSKELQ